MSMNTYMVFLRGVNVGGRVIKMAELRTNLEQAGFRNVRTLLQSGNVIVQSQAEAAQVKTHLQQTLSQCFAYPAKVQVLTREQVERIVAAYPFQTPASTQHNYVVFLENGLETALVAEPVKLQPTEQVAAGYGVVYWRVDKGQTLKSDFAKLLTKTKYRDFNTNRNLNTLQKMLAQAG